MFDRLYIESKWATVLLLEVDFPLIEGDASKVNVEVYSLLHIEPKEYSRVNFQNASFIRSIEVYFRNALTLQKSLKQIDLEFTLITNNAQYLEECFPKLVSQLNIREIKFTFPTPTGVRFYSSHFAFDVFDFLSKKSDSYSIYLDLDVVAINELSTRQIRAFTESRPIALDHTHQSIDEWKFEMQSDLFLTRGTVGQMKWYGGEYLSGDNKFFEAITNKISLLTPNYSDNIGAIHHKGMETLLTSALLELEGDGWDVCDATSYGLIVRIWDLPFKKQKEFYSCFQDFTFIHLPKHKEWLAELSNTDFQVKEIFRQFRRKSNSRLFTRALKRLKNTFINR